MRILLKDTAAIVVDYQEKIMPAMHDLEGLTRRSVTLLQGLNILGVPLLVSEQYVKGLGKTVAPIAEVAGDHPYYEKNEFSCCDNEAMMNAIRAMGKKNIIVCGIEAHVCVLQTVIDLLERGYNPVLVTDCVSSRREADRETAIKRALHEGAIVTGYEALLFELLRKSGGDTFKAISRLVK